MHPASDMRTFLGIAPTSVQAARRGWAARTVAWEGTMLEKEGEEQLRAALAAADRGMRLPYITVVVLSGIAALAVGVGLRHLDLSDPTHIVVACSVVLLFVTTQLTAGILQARQNAANARVIRALELLDDRITRP